MNASVYSYIKGFALEQIRTFTPRDTGNLRMFATRSEDLEARSFRIYVNASGDHSPRSTDGIAPYFHYVNYRERFPSGKPNPNYKYFDTAVEETAKTIAMYLGGELVE